MECPFCDGQARLQKKNRELRYRKEEFKVVEHFYKCEKCAEEYTTTETDTITILQAHNQYRERYAIPFPDEICALREKYELNATKMSEVLGLGVNGYSNYEKGEMPSLAIANLIRMAENPVVFKDMLKNAKHIFNNGAYENALNKVEYLIEKQTAGQPFYARLNQFDVPNNLTGYRRPNKEKISNVLVAFISKCNQEFNDRLKMNKLLFYTDFLNYKLFGYSVTGLSYRAIDYGPVPTFYDNIYTYFENEGVIESKWIKDGNGAAKETFVAHAAFDEKLFTETEKLIMETLADVFKDTSSWDLVDISHKEIGWIELHPSREIISYQQYAFDLKGA